MGPSLSLQETASLPAPLPGQALTYTLSLANIGPLTATGVIMTDIVPLSLTNPSVFSQGVAITQTSSAYAWQVQDLAPEEQGVGHPSGMVTLSGVLSLPLAAGLCDNTLLGWIAAVPQLFSSTARVTVPQVSPVAQDDIFLTEEDLTLIVPVSGVLSNDIDLHGDRLTATLVSTVSHGNLNLNLDGSFSYTPTEDFYGPDHFTYQAHNGIATLIITPTQDAPVAQNDRYHTDDDHHPHRGLEQRS